MKKLGRGLGAILEDVEAGYLKSMPNAGIKEIELSKIEPNPFQPRKSFNEESISELAKSIQKHGLMQPVIVIEKDNKYILVAGERRFRAMQYLSKEKITAIISDIPIKDLREYALIENIQREDLNPLEVAYSLKSLIDEYDFTHEELAKNIGKSRSYITNMLRILSLPEFVQNKLLTNKISFGHAKILSGLEENELKTVVNNIENKSLSVRETENLIKRLKNKSDKLQKNEDIKEEILILAQKIKKFGIKIDLGKDYVKLKFKNETDFQNLRNFLKKLD